MAATGNTEAEVNKNLDVDETEDAVKAAPGHLFGWYIFNASAGVRYVKYYDGLVADVVVGTTAPKMTIGIPAGAGANVGLPAGIRFGTAITIACTTAAADADTGAPGAGDVVVNTIYK